MARRRKTPDGTKDRESRLRGVVESSDEWPAERTQAGKALRESEERYRQLFELESDAIFLIDNETGQILEVNPAVEALYGYSREELLRMKNTDVSSEPDRTRQAVATQIKLVPIRWHRKKDGTVFPVEIAGSHFEWRGRKVHIAAIRDITERHRAEQERERLIGELQEALAEVKTLSGLLPICAKCKKIRDDKGYWTQIESYIQQRSNAQFSHGLCPECVQSLYSDMEE